MGNEHKRAASVIGAGTCEDDAIAAAAYAVGEGLARSGFTVVTGGLGGVMEAASHGANIAGGLVVAVLPGEDRSLATPFAQAVVCTGSGHARNLAVVASGDVVIAIGGEWGTLSEIGLARKIGRPVVVLSGWRLLHQGAQIEGIHYADNHEDAVRLAGNLSAV